MASEQTLLITEQDQSGVDQLGHVYDNGYLRIEHDNYYIKCAGNRISLPLKEFLIFSRLTRNVERVVTSKEIWRSVLGDNAPFDSLTLRVHIHRLRRTFNPLGVHLESMVGVGYFLSLSQADVEEANPNPYPKA